MVDELVDPRRLINKSTSDLIFDPSIIRQDTSTKNKDQPSYNILSCEDTCKQVDALAAKLGVANLDDIVRRMVFSPVNEHEYTPYFPAPGERSNKTYIELSHEFRSNTSQMEQELEELEHTLEVTKRRVKEAKEELETTQENNRLKETEVMKLKRNANSKESMFLEAQRKLDDVYLEYEADRLEHEKINQETTEVYEAMKKLETKQSLRGHITRFFPMGDNINDDNTSAPQHLDAKRQDKLRLDYNTVCLDLKQEKDTRSILDRLISVACSDRDDLRTQVEILEQAVQSIRLTMSDFVEQITLEGLSKAKELNIDSQDDAYITCDGTDDKVPPFLRYHGKVQNIYMTKRSVELIIKEIWSLKTIRDHERQQNNLSCLELCDFFMEYLHERFEDEKKMMQFSYNFVVAANKYINDEDVSLFMKILYNQVSEEYYYDQTKMMAHLKKLFFQLDILDGKRDGLIDTNVFFEGLSKFFPHKADSDMRNLRDVISRDVMYDGQIDIRKLLEETSDGDQSEFIEEIRKQYFMEINSFPQLIMNRLQGAADNYAKPYKIKIMRNTNDDNQSKLIRLKQQQDNDQNNDQNNKNNNKNNNRNVLLPAGQMVAILQDLDPLKTTDELKVYMDIGRGIEKPSQRTPAAVSSTTEQVRKNGILSPHVVTALSSSSRNSDNLVHLDDCNELVNIDDFMEKLSFLFLHRTGHYRPLSLIDIETLQEDMNN